MRFPKLLTASLFAVLALFQSCDTGVVIKPLEPETSGEVTVQLPASLDSKMNLAFKELHWNEADRPFLVRISEDQAFQVEQPSESICTEEGTARFTYIFPEADDDRRFWLCKNSGNASEAQEVTSWPLEIPSVQTPSAGFIDPAADVLVSNLTFALSKDFLSKYDLTVKLQRLNAVAALKMTGIPEDHVLKQLTITSLASMNGKRSYDIPGSSLSPGYDESKLVIKFTQETGALKEQDGSRKVLASFWPTVIDVYQVALTTEDKAGKSHEFTAKPNAFAPSVLLEAQCLTEWPLALEDVENIPELPETPKGPEGVIHGQEGATLDLFRKVKAYADNGISMVDDWWTHQLGYQGVVIHEAKVIQYGSPVHLWILEADPTLVGFEVGTPYNSDRVPAPSLQRVSGQAEEAEKIGKTVIAGINGDAWGARGGLNSYGLMFKDGKCLKNWAVLSNDIANMDTFYATDEGKVGIADEQAIKQIIADQNVDSAIGGWYRIISQGGEPYAQSGAKDGDPLLRDKSKTSGNLRNFLDRQPRTLIGVSEDRVYLVVADGRQSGWSVGLTLNGCARILYSLGCKRGVNLDGGGSSVMVKKSGSEFKVLNRPSDGVERDVVNSLLVVARK